MILLLALSFHKQIILHPLSLELRTVHPYGSIFRVIFVVNIWKVTNLNISFPVITSVVSANIFTFYLIIMKYSDNNSYKQFKFLNLNTSIGCIIFEFKSGFWSVSIRPYSQRKLEEYRHPSVSNVWKQIWGFCFYGAVEVWVEGEKGSAVLVFSLLVLR